MNSFRAVIAEGKPKKKKKKVNEAVNSLKKKKTDKIYDFEDEEFTNFVKRFEYTNHRELDSIKQLIRGIS